jgi:Na+-transporting methylmalonyl-CoA/oxaloacetate decarboxylase beta subunit
MELFITTFLNEYSVFSGLSKTIQNELIESITKVIIQTIESEVDKSVCFSWQKVERQMIFLTY